jgi:hypothetical protein
MYGRNNGNFRREKPRQGLANCSIILKKRGYSNENITRGFRNADLVSRE